MKICIVGAGYVGLAYLALFSDNFKVTIVDKDLEKLTKLKQRKLILAEKTINEKIKENSNNIVIKNIQENNYADYDVIFVCVSTNYDERINKLDTTQVKLVLDKIRNDNSNAQVIIKSTLPIGFCREYKKNYQINLTFSPEFLREGSSYYDVTHPSRIVYGTSSENYKNITKINEKLFQSTNNDAPVLFMSETEAETVKIFANTYLAMRVAFFNELDNFCIRENLSASNIISGVSKDKRIGEYYNNPSFGFGGYCLGKDSKQCASLMPNNTLINTINESNKNRKDCIIKDILSRVGNKKKIGIYKLAFKKDSDNFRDSAMFNIIEGLKKSGVNVIIFDESLYLNNFEGIKVYEDFEKFKNECDIIVANRKDKRVENLTNLYTRDIFNYD